jgi:dihydroflavonol-4-reductase
VILVTGATGFLGRSLAPVLAATGQPVRALARPDRQHGFLQALVIEVVPGDLTDRQSILNAMRGCEMVVHAGGLFRLWGEARQFERNNVEATAYVLEAALRCGVRRLIHISSVAVVGRPEPGRLIDETHPVQPVDDYQRSKLDAETVVRMYHLTTGIPAIILRPGAYYGPWGRYGWNRLFFEDPLRGLRLQVQGGRRITFPAYTPDVAAAVVAALRQGRPGQVYNICGEPLSHREANRVISRLAGISPFRLNVPGALMIALARAMDRSAQAKGREPFYPLNLASYVFHDWRVSSQKAREELGFVPTPFEAGACGTLQWYVEQGILNTRRAPCPKS